MSKPLFIGTPIKAMGDVVTGKTPETAVRDNYGTDYMFITPNELHDGYIIKHSEKRLSEIGFSSIKSNTISGTSVLVGCIGWDMGNVALSVDTCATNQQINSITNFKNGYNPYYVYYWLTTKKNYLFQIASVTRTPILNKSTFEEIIVPMPEWGVQNKIVSVLMAFDRKIQLNNRINAELEAMAKTIYDYWFVQFDFPDENGNPYKTSGGKMEWNESLKCEIPVGWTDGSFSDIANIIGGSTPPTDVAENFSSNGMAWITPKDLSINSGNKFITKGELDVSEKGIKAGSLKIMPKGTVLLSSRAPIGYMAIANEAVTTNQGFKSFVPKKHFSTPFVFYAVKNSLPEIINNSSGSTFKEVSGGALKTIKVPLPPKNVIESYTSMVTSIFERQSILESENKKLSNRRDWLLPLLMNGQVTLG